MLFHRQIFNQRRYLWSGGSAQPAASALSEIAANSEDRIAMRWTWRRNRSGGKILVDPMMNDWLDEPEQSRPIDPDQLYRLIDRADRMIVKEMPLVDSDILFESSGREDLDALKEALAIVVPDGSMHCMCLGTPAIELYLGAELVGQLTNHHGRSIRFSEWHSDAMLADREPWIDWFSRRGIDGPRREVEAGERQRIVSAERYERWLAAMPICLAQIWEQCQHEMGMVDTQPLSKTLRRSIPDRAERIRALLHWYGSGAGLWSGYPMYEGAAEALLFEEPHDQLVVVSLSADLSATQLEGAARLFGGWTYSKRYPQGATYLPEALKQRLWEHVKHTDNQDKLGRATRAFH
jgi:hypothetical protein